MDRGLLACPDNQRAPRPHHDALSQAEGAVNDTRPQPVMQTCTTPAAAAAAGRQGITSGRGRRRSSVATRRNVRPTGCALDGVVVPPSQRAAASAGAGAGAGHRSGAAEARRRTNHCSCRRGERVRQPGGDEPAEEPIRRSRASRRSLAEGVKASASGRPGPWKVSSTRTATPGSAPSTSRSHTPSRPRVGRQHRRTEERAALPTARPRAAGDRWSRRREPHATTLRDMAHITPQVVHRSTIPEYCRQCLVKGKPSWPVTQVTR